jgi:thioredoxin reductase
VRENFETNLGGVYIVGELGGMGLIKTAINEGRLAIDYIRSELQQTSRANGEYDVAIVGAGPAGLSASLTALQHDMRYITIEQGDIASTIRQYPRQKFLMAEPIDMPLYGNLYVADGTKEALLGIWESIVANTGVQVRTNERVDSVRKTNGLFDVATSKGTYKARRVVLAMGKRGTPHRLDVPGADLAKVTYRLIEADSYENKDVLVVGGGDSAVEAVLALSKGKRNRVTLSYRGGEFTRLRPRNLEQLRAAENGRLCTVLRNSNLRAIRPDSVALEVAGVPTDLKNDFVLGLIGGESPEAFLRKLGIEIVEKTL